MVAGLDAAAELGHHHLLAVADAEDRHAEREDLGRRARAALLGDAGRAAGEDHRLRAEGAQEAGVDCLERVDLAVDPGLAEPPGDQLGDLAAEVDDQEALVVGMGHRQRNRVVRTVPQEVCRPALRTRNYQYPSDIAGAVQ